MPNLNSRKVIIPAVLFAALSPGVLLQLPDKIPGINKNSISTSKSSRNSVIVHAIVFAILYRIIAQMNGMVLQPADILIPTLLFVLLSPGMILKLGQNHITSVLIHTIVFMVIFAFLRKQFPQYY